MLACGLAEGTAAYEGTISVDSPGRWHVGASNGARCRAAGFVTSRPAEAKRGGYSTCSRSSGIAVTPSMYAKARRVSSANHPVVRDTPTAGLKWWKTRP
jgi:hypothetical protein